MNSKNIFLILIFYSVFASCSKIHKHDLVISNVNIIDVKSGNILKNQTVAIDSNVISKIYKSKTSFSETTKIIDGTDKYLIPGFWDMHIHYYWNHKDINPLLIANGIVGVREMWGELKTIYEVRNKIEKNEILAPDIITSGPVIDGNPPIWPLSINVADSAQAAETTLKQIESGVDFIKVYSFLSNEEFSAIAKVANERNVPFAGHIPDAVSIWDAAELGMSSAEHFLGLVLGCSEIEDSLRSIGETNNIRQELIESFSPDKFDSLCLVLVENDLWLCPTFVSNQFWGNLIDTTFFKDSRLKYLPKYVTKNWIPEWISSADKRIIDLLSREKQFFDFELNLIGKMSEREVKFLAGTDYPNPYTFAGFSLHDELEFMVKGGLNELEALKTATLNPAVFLKKENEFGSVEEGKLASLVLLNKNPLDDISNTKSINTVILRGTPLSSQQLDSLLNSAEYYASQPLYSEWLSKKISSDGLAVALDSFNLILNNENTEYLLVENDLDELGLSYLHSNKITYALAIFEKCTKLFPDSWRAYYSYAAALYENKQYNLALSNYEKVMELNPYYFKAETMIDSINSLTYKMDSY